ncbi:YitT family protein [Orenia metallireducens]|nr:YitT family protein [Orenia metallireducens]
MRKQTIYDYFWITIGSIITAAGLVMFLIPNKIAAGGVSGLSTVIYYLFGLPVGMVSLAINIPLFIIGVKEMGAKFGIRTLYGIFLLSFGIDLLNPYLPVLTHDPLLASIYGGGVSGLGLGLVFRSKGTTGGTDLVAQLINKFTGISVGKSLMIIDFCVIALAGIVFNAEIALYAFIAMMITGKAIDIVQEGLKISKGTFIISDYSEEIRKNILEKMDRGVTILKGKGGFTEHNKDVLLCIISRSEVSDLKRIVHNIDENAFVIITEVHEVLGEGFNENAFKD